MQTVEPADEILNFKFTLIPAIKPEQLHENMRSSIARNLPVVTRCQPHALELSVAGGGPSLEDTYKELTGQIAAVNGSLSFLLDRDVVPDLCGVCDPSPHMVDIIEPRKSVNYFLASTVHPSVYDKLINAGCYVVRWNVSSIPGGEAILDELEPESLTIGGGSTMGLRWLTLGYTCGFRNFHLHGLDSSFRIDPKRGKASHAYPDHQDAKTDWITFDGYQTRINFIGQVSDFLGWMGRLQHPDVEPISITVHGDGLLQSKFAEWKRRNPGKHEGREKPKMLTDDFIWPAGDVMGALAIREEVKSMDQFMAHVNNRRLAIQAGGNVGVYPAHLAQYFNHVHTFEPDMQNYICLSKNIDKNIGNVAAYHAALGDRIDTVGMIQAEPDNAGAIRISGEGDVPMRRIDDLKLDACDLIWLDIEGYEELALIGGTDTINRFRPAIIIEENSLPEKHGLNPGGARMWLEDHGYKAVLKIANDCLFLPC